MKKNTGYFILLLVLILCCAGCTAVGKNDTDCEGNSSEDPGVGGDYSGDIEAGIEPSTEPSEQEGVDFVFDSYEEFDRWIQPDEFGNAPIMEEMELHGTIYKAFVEDVIEGKLKIVKPYWGEDLMELESKSYAEIYVMDYNQGRIHIWYMFPGQTNVQPRIKLCYLTEEEIEYSKNHSIEEFCRYLKDWNGEGFLSVDTLDLQNRTVSILIEDCVGAIRVNFVYDNMYVAIELDEADFDSMDWTQFSLRTE